VYENDLKTLVRANDIHGADDANLMINDLVNDSVFILI